MEKIDWKWAVIALLLGLLLSPHAHASKPTESGLSIKHYSKAKTLPATSLKPQAELDSIPIAEPAPVNTPPVIGCGSDPYMAQIYMRESGCRTTAMNPSGAYGLCQSLPAIKMASFGADYLTSWSTQNAWCIDYANHRYGSPAQAWAFWCLHSWW